MKKVIAIGLGSGACVLALIGLTSWRTPPNKDRHCPPPDAQCQSTDPHCQPPQNPENCDQENTHGGVGHMYAASAEEDASEGHAGFGESAGAHGGSGGE